MLLGISNSWFLPVATMIVHKNLVLLSTLVSSTLCFYLPGLAPVNYCEKSEAIKKKGSCRVRRWISVLYHSLDGDPLVRHIIRSVLFMELKIVLPVRHPGLREQIEYRRASYAVWVPLVSDLSPRISHYFLYQFRMDSDSAWMNCSFDFCRVPEEISQSPVENLGQVLFGERIRPSPYNVSLVDSYSDFLRV